MENKEFLTRDEAIAWMVHHPYCRIKDTEGKLWFYPFNHMEHSRLVYSSGLRFRNPDYTPPKKPEPLTFEEAVELRRRGKDVYFYDPSDNLASWQIGGFNRQEWVELKALSDAGIPLYAEEPEEGEG